MATFIISYLPGAQPTAPQQADITEAAAQWGAAIADELDINVQVVPTNLGGLHNAMCIPGLVQHNGRTLTRTQAKLLDVPIVYPDAGRLDMVVLIDAATPWVTGFTPPPVLGPGQYSLLTTMLHELCHGLGFLGLCNLAQEADRGIYSDTGLTELLPHGIVPPGFFPDDLQAGFGWITPFAWLFSYQGVFIDLVKGNPPDDFVAFMSAPGSVVIPDGLADYPVLTANNDFVPFTTCDHIIGTEPTTGKSYLMSSSTAGQSIMAPDPSSRALLHAIGWNCQAPDVTVQTPTIDTALVLR